MQFPFPSPLSSPHTSPDFKSKKRHKAIWKPFPVLIMDYSVENSEFDVWIHNLYFVALNAQGPNVPNTVFLAVVVLSCWDHQPANNDMKT